MSRNDLSFAGKVAVVTGGTRGIGKAMVEELCRRDCHVIYTGTDNKRVSQKWGREYWPLDLSDDASVDVFCKRLGKIRRLDILINNAGINVIEPITKVTPAHWDRIIKVNLTGAMRLTQQAARVMGRNCRGGKILNVSSIFGVVAKARRCSYSASKAGLVGLTRACALDLAPNNILVNALCPGFTLTDLTRRILSKKDMRELCAQIPLKRFAREEEIARVGMFLCSDANTYITGQTIVADGGMLTQ